jgi:L,D-transpeptidase ErfK/SrfK
MEWLFQQVQRGATGEIIYEPIKVAVSDGGSVYLEVRTDLYRRLKSPGESARKMIEARGLSGRVDMSKVERVIKEKTGVAEDVTFLAKAAPATYARLLDRLRTFFASLFGRRQ